MTVKQLLAALKDVHPDAEVVLADLSERLNLGASNGVENVRVSPYDDPPSQIVILEVRS